MINKKILAVTALTLLLSQQSFACEEKGVYLGGSYYGQFFNDTGLLEVKKPTGMRSVTVNDRDTQKTEAKFLKDYKVDYTPPFAASLAFGYSGEFKNHNYRAELEATHSLIKVDNIGLANSQINVSYKKKEGGKDEEYGVVVNHDHIENTSAIVNIYHYWKNDRFSFSPYVGAGIGITRMKMFKQGSIRPAYQLKAGLNYRMTEDTYVHIGYRHFGTIGTNFDLTANKLEKQKNDKGDEVIVLDKNAPDPINIGNKLFTTHGLEVGLTIHFGSKA